MESSISLVVFITVIHLSFYGCQQMEPTVSSSAIQDLATQTPPLIDQQISLNQVLDQEWILELITENGQGKKPVADTEVTLRFSAEKLTGSAGCNRYFASYQTGDDRQLSITDIASTEMWCLQPEGIMEQETKFLQWLNKANSYGINDDQLTLYGNDREQKLVFRKKHD
ncbi:TPA: META domain-containing protein [Candidatus Poribacteria bacterium]|nr:META domain-containing protein [Candidatus Poribacteria bacterium]HIB92575.1 META domain-containing protein [Candidatus Poribacteria bacterium]HIM11170.1 META domain-containing protein [Candidatus Poribacteria bacterium]